MTPHSLIKTNIGPINHEIIDSDRKGVFKDSYDGYHHYIDILKKTRIYENNPYFPRIRSVKTKNYANNRSTHNIEVEKLIDASEIEINTLLNYISNIIDMKTEDMDDLFQTQVLEAAIRIITRSPSKIIDPLLRDAIRFINDNKENFLLDLYTSNVMFRRWKYGIQMVFNDPYGEGSINKSPFWPLRHASRAQH
jgi:hypothetical protein